MPTPRSITQSVIRALNEGKTNYTENRGIPQLRENIAHYIQELRGIKLSSENISVTPSGVNALMQVMQCLLSPGDNVIVVTPVWPNCTQIVEDLNAQVRRVPLTFKNGRWCLEIENIIKQKDHRTKAVLINSPNNPTGWSATATEINKILAFAREQKIWYISDDVYERISYDGLAPSVIDFALPDDLVVSINSFSKTWNMTGWRLGWITAPEGLGPALSHISELNVSCATSFVQYAGIAALSEKTSAFEQRLSQFKVNRDYVLKCFSEVPRAEFAKPSGAFYVFFRVPGVSSSTQLALQILEETGVGLAPGSGFGPEGEGWLRLCYARNPRTLEAAMGRLIPYLCSMNDTGGINA